MHGCNEPRQHMSNLIYIQWKVLWWWRGRHSTNYVIIIKYMFKNRNATCQKPSPQNIYDRKWKTRMRVQKMEGDGGHEHTCMWRVHMSMDIRA